MDETKFQFHWRRIPGTLSLAITNLIAGLVAFFPPEDFEAGITAILAKYASAQVWGSAFLVSGVLLVIAAIIRRWGVLNVGSGLSLFMWLFVGGVFLQAWVTGTVAISPIALSLIFWIMVGQATMLFVPLWARGRGYE